MARSLSLGLVTGACQSLSLGLLFGMTGVALAPGLHPRLQNTAVGLCAPCFCFQIILDLSSIFCLPVSLSVSVSQYLFFFQLLLSLEALYGSASFFHSFLGNSLLGYKVSGCACCGGGEVLKSLRDSGRDCQKLKKAWHLGEIWKGLG